jgi:hypothetical protein
MRRVSIIFFSALAFIGGVSAAAADFRDSFPKGGGFRNDTVIYSSIVRRLPGNVASVGPEAYAYKEFGDGLVFTPGADGKFDDVRVVLSSWGCTSGRWYTLNCVTSPKGKTFKQSITLNIYSVIDVAGVPTKGTQLVTVTKTFDVPYRPSANNAKCTGDNAGKWYSDRDETCYNGIASIIDFDISSLRIAVPDKAIVTFAYNSTHYGPTPIGEGAACYASNPGCPYDSLNISSDGPGGYIGAPIDPNGTFINYYFQTSYCQPHVWQGDMVQLDNTDGCWDGYHPQIEVTSNDRKRRRPNRKWPFWD